MKRLSLVLIAVIIGMFVLGCESFSVSPETATTQPQKSNYLLPPISDFSSTEYSESTYHFPEIDHAIWHHDGISEDIDANDPRLFQLLNSLIFSYEKGYTAWQQGHVEDQEFLSYVNSNCPMLDIYFKNYNSSDEESEFAATPRVVISANRYLLLVDTAQSSWMQDGGIYANEHFPYVELISEYCDLTLEEKQEVYGDSEWGNDKWINLLEYAGFIVEDA